MKFPEGCAELTKHDDAAFTACKLMTGKLCSEGLMLSNENDINDDRNNNQSFN